MMTRYGRSLNTQGVKVVLLTARNLKSSEMGQVLINAMDLDVLIDRTIVMRPKGRHEMRRPYGNLE